MLHFTWQSLAIAIPTIALGVYVLYKSNFSKTKVDDAETRSRKR